MRTTEHAHRRRARFGATAAAAVLGVVGVTAVAVALARQDPTPPAPPTAAPTVASPSPSGSGSTAPEPAPSSPAPSLEDTTALDYSEPTTIAIPSLDVRSRLVDIGLDPQGAMETPVPVDKAGWFTPSPPPGVPGATVIAGHVTWNQEPMVFFELGNLRKGDTVEVAREDGAVVVYEVTRTGSFPKDEFPTDAVYSQPDQPELRLITCGGEYDAVNHRYLANVIVWAEMVDVRNGDAGGAVDAPHM